MFKIRNSPQDSFELLESMIYGTDIDELVTLLLGTSSQGPSLSKEFQEGAKPPSISPSRIRTYDLAVNSRSLYRLSYRGIKNCLYIGLKYNSLHRPTAIILNFNRFVKSRCNNNSYLLPPKRYPPETTSKQHKSADSAAAGNYVSRYSR